MATITISESSNNKTVTLPVGDHLLVQLHSTYWSFAYPVSSALVKISASTVPGGAGCPTFPGSGCGAVSVTFNAKRVAAVQISAHRTSCGEAMLCTGAKGHWTARIRITNA